MITIHYIAHVIKLAVICIIVLVSLVFIAGLASKPSEESAKVSDTQTVNTQQEASVSDLSVFYKQGSLLQLVNRQYGLPCDYEPIDLVELELTTSTICSLRQEAATHLSDLFVAAKEAGTPLICVSGYRSYETQKLLYETECNVTHLDLSDSRYNVLEICKTYSEVYDTAPPGYSEHQTGLAVDVDALNSEDYLHQDFALTQAGQWLQENCYKYGFIIRYQESKQPATGYIYEPWHIRYVGVEVATQLHDRNLCYEEYIAELEIANSSLQ